MADLDIMNSNVSITIKASDLKAFSESLVASAINKYRDETFMNPREMLYTSQQVADILSVSRVTLFNWDKRDYLKPIRVGGLVRYRKSDIDSILHERK